MSDATLTVPDATLTTIVEQLMSIIENTKERTADRIQAAALILAATGCEVK